MMPIPGVWRLLVLPALLLVALLLPVQGQESGPQFALRTAGGATLRGPQLQIAADWSVRVARGDGRRTAGEDVVSVRREGLVRPGLPTADHLILFNGDRFPVKDVRLDGERLRFVANLEGGKEASLPVAAVAVYWRIAPDKTPVPERLRRQLADGSRTRDLVLLRNGDVLSGVLNGLNDRSVEVEVEKKKVTADINQVAAIALSTDLAERARPKGLHARLVLLDGGGPTAGRLTLTNVLCDGKVLRGKTVFGALVRLPVARVAALDFLGGKAVYLSDLKPTKYEYRPFLDERWPWSADATVRGRDQRLGGAVYDKGVGMHSASALTYRLGGAYQRFETLVGLDDLDGRGGAVRLRVLADGKPLDLGGADLSHARGPRSLNLKVAGVKELTLDVGWGDEGPVRGVVNWADARLVK